MGIHKEKLKTDLDLAEKKVAADIKLSQTKFALDRQLADWKRKTEVAEKVLADFYKARDIFGDARQPFARGDDGATRPGRGEGETEGERGYRDSIYAPYERLMRERDFFSEMNSRRFRFMALFGEAAAQPFLVFVRVFNEVGSATGILLRDRPNMSNRQRQRYEDKIGWTLNERDEMKERLDAAVGEVEAICAPVLRAIPHE